MATSHRRLALVLLVALSLFTLAPRSSAQHCRPFGHFIGTSPPAGKCNPSVSDCCVEVGGPTACDASFHSDEEPVVALPTGWYAGGKRCGKEIVVKTREGNIARARVIDHCDSAWGCDEAHRYEAPCRHNAVDASRAVWKELGVPEGEWKELNVTWAEV